MASKSEPLFGYTPSAWKSLAVKSQRAGWAEGLRQAEMVLGKSQMKYLLRKGVFEDTFPAVEELADCLDEVTRLDYLSLCARETLHGRGYAEAYCDLPSEVDPKELYPAARQYGLYVPESAWSNFAAWVALEPHDAGVQRGVDTTKWRGMPLAMLDSHTREGWVRFGGAATFLSGTNEMHRALGVRVMKEGWAGIRKEMHASIDRAERKKPVDPVERARARHLRKQARREKGER